MVHYLIFGFGFTSYAFLSGELWCSRKYQYIPVFILMISLWPIGVLIMITNEPWSFFKRK